MKINYGPEDIEYALSVNGTPVGDWKVLDVPKEGTAILDTAESTKNEAKDDHGKVQGAYNDPGTSTLTFELFKKKGFALPFDDKDGVIEQEYAFRVKNHIDPSAPGFQLDRCQVSARRLWSKTEAYRVAYTATALEPAEGDMVKELGVDLDEHVLNFTAAADSTGKTVNVVNHSGTVTVQSGYDTTMITTAPTVTVAQDGTVSVKVKIAANSTTSARTTTVTVKDAAGFTADILVVQEAGAGA